MEGSKDSENNTIHVVMWRCGNEDCNRIILTQHIEDISGLKLSRFLDGTPKGPEWPKLIEEMKSGHPNDIDIMKGSRFIKTYLQSLVAENMGLDELAGMGYRKSIEYLVKDWAINLYPEKRNEIFNNWLDYVIKNFFQGELKEILLRATWLGNDQSHYNQLFQDYNIGDLKELIDLIVVDLDREHKKKQYIANIQKRK
jgi:hypothetical protein